MREEESYVAMYVKVITATRPHGEGKGKGLQAEDARRAVLNTTNYHRAHLLDVHPDPVHSASPVLRHGVKEWRGAGETWW